MLQEATARFQSPIKSVLIQMTIPRKSLMRRLLMHFRPAKETKKSMGRLTKNRSTSLGSRPSSIKVCSLERLVEMLAGNARSVSPTTFHNKTLRDLRSPLWVLYQTRLSSCSESMTLKHTRLNGRDTRNSEIF